VACFEALVARDTCREGRCVVVHQGHLKAVVTLLIGCAVLLIGVGCAGGRSQSAKEQGHTEATNKEQTRSPQATGPEEARCEGTRTFKNPHLGEEVFTTNDLPGCPNKGGLLSGTDNYDSLSGEDGNDKIRGHGSLDSIFAGPGNDVIYGGPGGESPLIGEEGDDVIYGGTGHDWVLKGSEGNDVIYGGPGNDVGLLGGGDGQRDKLYCGKGRDKYTADKVDYVDSSCEKKLPFTPTML
jgi:hypothetical protein